MKKSELRKLIREELKQTSLKFGDETLDDIGAWEDFYMRTEDEGIHEVVIGGYTDEINNPEFQNLVKQYCDIYDKLEKFLDKKIKELGIEY